MNSNMKLKKLLRYGLLGLALSGLPAYAQVFNYTDGDLILDFSEANYPDVEVDIGSLASLTNAAATSGGTVEISAYNLSTQLIGNFGSVDSVSFSVIGQQYNQNGSINAGTVYLTQKQTGSSPNTPPASLNSIEQANAQGTVLAVEGLDDLGNISTKGILPWSASQAADPVINTATVAIIPTSGLQDINSYTKIVGSSFLGAPTNPKNTTPASFTSGSIVSDLFTFDPANNGTSNPSTYDGYFTLNSDGTLYFSLPVPPSTKITSITRSSGTVSVNFNTVIGVNYTLLYSTSLSLNRTNWTVIPGSVAGTGSTGTLNDTAPTGATRFYSVKSSY
jgi:hypothetical protein